MSPVRELQCPSVVVEEFTGDPVSYDCRRDGEAQFSIVLEGVLTDRGERHCFECGPGSITFRPPGTTHSVTSSGAARAIRLAIHAERFAEWQACTGLDPLDAAQLHGLELAGLVDQIRFELRRTDRERPLMLESLTVMLVARFAAVLSRRNEQARPRWLDEALEVIRTRSREASLTSDGVATSLGVPTADLHAALVQFEGGSLHDLLQKTRVDWAREQLRSTRRAIAAIAQEAGFYDNSHMVRAFRRLLGTTPSAYRQAHGAGAAGSRAAAVLSR